MKNKTLIVITCGAKKREEPTMVKDLYLGQHFKAFRRYAESTDHDWYVIGRKFGLLHPDKIMEPYDFKPPRFIEDEWGDEIRQNILDLGYNKVLMACNKAYYRPLSRYKGVRWAFIDIPRPGIGYQRQWVKQNLGIVPEIEGFLHETI